MRSTQKRVLVVAGGSLGDLTSSDVPPHSHVVAADSGALSAKALNLSVDIAVGDFDSLPPDVLAELRKGGTEVRSFPVAKDATDLEIAMDAALALGPSHITVLGGAGGRLDHLVGNITLLSNRRYAGVEIVAFLGSDRITVVHSTADLFGQAADLLSLFAMNGDAFGVSTTGLLYPLNNETLDAASSRGVSNRFVAERATVTVGEGVVVAVQPRRPLEPALP